MSLNTILELCEKHMNEGDYLLAAETLKNVHDKKPVCIDGEITIIFDEPIILRKMTNDREYPDDFTDCKILGIVKVKSIRTRRLMIKKIICEFYGNRKIVLLGDEHNFDFRCKNFIRLLKSFFTIELFCNIEYKNHFEIYQQFRFQDYTAFKKEYMISILDDNDEQEWCPDYDVIYIDFLDFVIDRIIETIGFYGDEE